MTKNYGFHPDCVIVKAGSTDITVTNKDRVVHIFSIATTTVSITVKAKHSARQAGVDFAPGTYDFYCMIHPGMTGTLVVTSS